jgi:hypothetical protein
MAETFFDKLAPHLLGFLTDEQYVSLDFLWHEGRLPRLRAPETFDEKILWLRLHYRDELLRQCTDKLLVREYVRKAVSEDLLIPLLGVYNTPAEIPLADLPDAFILKATHGSGWNVICRSRASFDLAEAAARLSKYLGTSYYDFGREWAYAGIPPRILCETLLLDETGEVPTDCKIYCFHGEPALIQLSFDRFRALTLNFYDTDWRLLPCRRQYPNNLKAPRDPPVALPAMLNIARQLAQPFPFVRVDLYSLGRRVFFGEMTFYPGRGVTPFEPRSFEYTFGRLLDLSRIRAHVV